MQGSLVPAKPAVDYVANAASGDMLEIQTSQLALERSRNAPVRAFAEQMTKDHPSLSQALMTAARNSGVTPPPPALTARHADMLKMLGATAPAQFDAAYIKLQVAAHEEALALHRAYAASGDNTSLKSAAASAVPVVQGHLQHVQALNAHSGR